MKNVKPYIVGIDPGAKGGVACLRVENGSPPTLLFCEDLPYLGGRLDAIGLSDLLSSWGTIHLAVVEKAQAMPRKMPDGATASMGTVSMFNYGMSYGMILGTLSGLSIPYDEVHPATWKKSMGLGKDKTAARAMAKSKFPLLAFLFARVKDDGRAESALIGLYATQRWTKEGRAA